MNYKIAIEILGSCEQKKIGNNTYLVKRQDGCIAIRLHATDILTFRPDGTVEVRTNGWRSVTTKARINEYSPSLGVAQVKGVWYWGPYTLEMMEGDVIDGSGNVVRANGAICGLELRKVQKN